MGIEKRLIEDANLTRGMQLATPERITKVIRDVLKGEAGARVKVYEQTLSLIHISEPTRH